MRGCTDCNIRLKDDPGNNFCPKCGKPVTVEENAAAADHKATVGDKNVISHDIIGKSLTADKDTAAGDYKATVGDKNVISGDIIGKREDISVAGNATFHKTEDDTKRSVECSLTGKRVPYVESIVCPACKNDVSKDVYNDISRRCLKCEEDAKLRYETEVGKALADGKIDIAERIKLDKLARYLSLDTTTKRKVESEVKISIKDSMGKTELSPYHKHEFDRAVRLLFYQNDLEKASMQLKKVYKKNKGNDDVACIYFLARALHDPEDYVKQFEQRNVDTFWQHFWAFYPYVILQKDDEANELIESNKVLYPDQAAEVVVSEVAFYILCSRNLAESQYVEEAQKHYGSLEYNPANVFLRQFLQAIGAIIDPENLYDKVSDQDQDDNAMVKFFEKYFFNMEKKHPDGDYQGEWKGSKRHGKGVMTWQDGSTYEGHWEDDCRRGQGIMRYAGGDVYDGEWENDKKHGNGTMTWQDGSTYEGHWEDDCRHGQGIMRYAGGDVYEGEWENDKKHGNGTMTWQDGSTYEGHWEDDCRHGQGIMRYAGGDVYDGEWENDKKHGNGTMTWQDGSTYEGHWEDDCRHGQGTMHFENGDVYSGNWENGEIHGKGTMTDKQKNVYAGEWEKGNKQGFGKMDFNDGNVYEGQWEDNMFHGEGSLTWALDGTVYKGDFYYGNRHGHGIIHYADGDEYEGEWKNDAMHGKGRYVYADGQIIEGEWEDGELIDDDIPF